MKIIAALLILCPTTATATPTDIYEGQFTAVKTVQLPSLQTSAACNEGGGRWRAGACYFTTSDDVSIGAGFSEYEVEVATVGTDAKSCRFDGGVGRAIDPDTLKARKMTLFGPCELTIHYSNRDSISVEASPACHAFCEANGTLEIREAKRIDVAGP